MLSRSASALAATINFLVRAPRMFAEILGKLLFWCGEDKIIYGSEASIFHPQWALRAFMGLRDPRGPVRRVRIPAADRPGEAEDPRREPAAPARNRRAGDEDQAGRWRQLSLATSPEALPFSPFLGAAHISSGNAEQREAN